MSPKTPAMTVRYYMPINVTETTPDTRRMYRSLRRAGFDRDVVNYLIAGVIIGANAGGLVTFGPMIPVDAGGNEVDR